MNNENEDLATLAREMKMYENEKILIQGEIEDDKKKMAAQLLKENVGMMPEYREPRRLRKPMKVKFSEFMDKVNNVINEVFR